MWIWKLKKRCRGEGELDGKRGENFKKEMEKNREFKKKNTEIKNRKRVRLIKCFT